VITAFAFSLVALITWLVPMENKTSFGGLRVMFGILFGVMTLVSGAAAVLTRGHLFERRR